MLEVFVDKQKYSQHMIYPYFPNLEYMTFDSKEDKEFFVPTSIGSGAGDKKRVTSRM